MDCSRPAETLSVVKRTNEEDHGLQVSIQRLDPGGTREPRRQFEQRTPPPSQAPSAPAPS
jgi:hypothetical protein